MTPKERAQLLKLPKWVQDFIANAEANLERKQKEHENAIAELLNKVPSKVYWTQGFPNGSKVFIPEDEAVRFELANGAIVQCVLRDGELQLMGVSSFSVELRVHPKASNVVHVTAS